MRITGLIVAGLLLPLIGCAGDAAPRVVDDATIGNVLRAVDAASGKLLWEYDPQVIRHAGDRLRIMWDASRGIAFYYCVMCHGAGAVSGGMAPDLRASPIVLSRESFEAVVLGGALRDNGMSRFPNLAPEQTEKIRHYVRSMVPPVGERADP